MEKLGSLLLAILLLLSLGSCAYQDPVLDSLPDHISKEFYTSGGFQDYTDYAQYTYDSIPAEALKSSKYFTVTTGEDVDEILSYIDNFEARVEAIGGELKENYDFDRSTVTEGDLFYIKTKEGGSIGQGTYGKFDDYSVYYFDIDALVLYYFHNNI